jgi:hypothetical protein
VSAGSAEAEASVPSPDSLSVTSRLIGVIRRPRSTFEAVSAAPRWGGLLILLFAVSFALSAAFFATEVGQQALVDQWERTATAFGQPVDDARYAAFQEMSRNAVSYAALTTLVSGPAAAVALALGLYGAFTGLGHGGATFRQVLSVVVHASVILVLRQIIAAPLNYARESIASPTTLVRLLSGIDEGSALARLGGLIDLFVVWWVMVLAIGIAVLYRKPARKVSALFLGAYVVIAFVLVGTMAILGGTT